MAKRTRTSSAKTVECWATTAGWCPRTPDSPRTLIKEGETVQWELQHDEDGKARALPSWLKPRGEYKPPPPARPDPATLSEAQAGGRVRRPPGA